MLLSSAVITVIFFCKVSESITDPVVLEGHQRRVQHVSTVRERTVCILLTQHLH
jgi:hypothetical protein